MTKRIISVLLALVLVLALAMPAMAESYSVPAKGENGYTLTINDESADREYTVFQVFTGTLGQVGDDLILGDIAWSTNVNTAATDFPYAGKTAAEVAATLKTVADAKLFAAKIGPFVSNGVVADYDATNKKHVASNLTPGYYLVKETTVLDEGETASAFMTAVVANATATPKRSGVPTGEKDQTYGPTYDLYAPIEFTLKAKVPTGIYDKFDTYEFYLVDTMSVGLEFDEVTSFTVNGEDFEKAESVTKNDGVTTLRWDWEDLKTSGIKEGDEIVIKYNAHLTEDAVVGVEGNENEFKVIYSNNPDQGGTGETVPDTEIVFTFDLKVNKVDADNNAIFLPEAQFKLYKETTDGDKYLAISDNKEVTWVDATSNEVEVLKTNAGGNFTIDGLAAGTYKLVETKAPAGYNLLTAPLTIEIIMNNGKLIVKVDGEELKDGEGNIIDFGTLPACVVDIENAKGATLPETGGIGTTIFYLVGGLMMAAAVVLLVAKKRTVNE